MAFRFDKLPNTVDYHIERLIVEIQKLGFRRVYVRSPKRYYKSPSGNHVRIDFDNDLVALLDRTGYIQAEENLFNLQEIRKFNKI